MNVLNEKLLSKLSDVRLIKFPQHKGSDSQLIPYESKLIPFSVTRFFTIKTDSPIARGHHAHRLCQQLLVCLAGKCEVTCDDGQHKETIVLDDASVGLLIPASIWASQNYLIKNTILWVICDQPYDEDDYIRDYDLFLQYRGA